MSAFSYSGFASVAPVQVSLKASCCAPKAESAANAVQYLVLWLFTFNGDANLSPSRCRCSRSTPMRASGHAQWFFIWTCLPRSLLVVLFLYLCSRAVTSMAKPSCAPPDAWCLAASCCSLSLEMVCVQWPLLSYTRTAYVHARCSLILFPHPQHLLSDLHFWLPSGPYIHVWIDLLHVHMQLIPD